MTTYYPQLLLSRLLLDADRTVLANDDADVTDWHKGVKIILATQIGYNGKDTAASYYRLDWRNVTDGGSFAPVGATGEVKYSATSAVLADQTAVTSTTRRCTAASGQTWQNGLESVNDNLCPSTGTLDLGSDSYTELQWALDLSGALNGKQYEFRLWNLTQNATVGTCAAQITTAPAVAFSGVAAAVSTVSAPALLLLKALSGATALSTVTPDITLDIPANEIQLSGAAALVTATPNIPLQPDVLLNVERDLSAAATINITTSEPSLLLLKALAGAAALDSMTPSVTLDVSGGGVINLSGVASLTSTVSGPALLLLKVLSGVAALDSAVSSPTLLLLRALSGVAAMGAAASTSALLLLKALSGAAGMDSVASTPVIGILRPLSGTSSLVTATPSITVTSLIPLSGTVSLVTATPSITVTLLKALTGVAAANIAASPAAMLMLRALSGSVGLVTVTPNIELSIQGMINFSGLAVLQTATTNTILGVLRPLAGAASFTSATPSAALLLLKALSGAVSMDMAVSSPLLKLLRSMSGVATLDVYTSDIDFITFTPAPEIHGELQVLIHARLLSVLPECRQLSASPECRQLFVSLEIDDEQ